MFANVGNSGGLQPDASHFQYKAEPIKGGISLDLSKKEVPVGTWVKLSIFTSSPIRMKLSALMRKGNSEQLSLK